MDVRQLQQCVSMERRQHTEGSHNNIQPGYTFDEHRLNTAHNDHSPCPAARLLLTPVSLRRC